MIIEWLKFKISPDRREEFIQKDTEIWTAAISAYPGYLGKEVWIDPNAPEEVVILVRWATYQQWKSLSSDYLAKVEQEFSTAMAGGYELIEEREYHLRKFPHSAAK